MMKGDEWETNEWVLTFFGMPDDEQTIRLRDIVRRANRSLPPHRKKTLSTYLKGVRLRTDTNPYVEAIVLHLETHTDERGIGGYLTKTLAAEYNLVKESITAQKWVSLMKRASRRIPSLIKHNERAPFKQKMGTRPVLYITDRCDVKRLYNLREEIYDPTQEKDALTMVERILRLPHIQDSAVGDRFNLVELASAVTDVLFPKWTHNDLSMISQFTHAYLIPAFREHDQDWSAQSATIVRRL